MIIIILCITFAVIHKLTHNFIMTVLQYKFLDILDEFGYDIFNLKMIRDIHYFSDNEIIQALRTLTKSGIIIKLEQGKYIRKGFNDEFVIGNFLAQDGGIAYWSALNFHALTEQFPNVIHVQTAKRSGHFTFNNLRYKFIKVNKRKLLGYSLQGYGNHSYRITDVEKTLADCFDLPQHAGWYHETVKSFNNAKINARKLTKYCKAVNNISVIKRMGFLCELIQKPNMEYFIKYAQSVLKDEYSLFETGGENKGAYNKRWKLIVNLPEDEIIEIAKS